MTFSVQMIFPESAGESYHKATVSVTRDPEVSPIESIRAAINGALDELIDEATLGGETITAATIVVCRVRGS